MSPRVLLINGSPSGQQGNSASVLNQLMVHLQAGATIESLVLAESFDLMLIESQIRASDGFVFATGTYWDSWGSPLQRFFESMTALEATEAWLGKPAAVLVTMHSVGGKGVLSRLQGVLNSLGVLIPPLTGWVYAASGQAAIAVSETPAGSGMDRASVIHAMIVDDLWRLADLEVVAHNLLAALYRTNNWRAWSVDRAHFETRWIEPADASSDVNADRAPW